MVFTARNAARVTAQDRDSLACALSDLTRCAPSVGHRRKLIESRCFECRCLPAGHQPCTYPTPLPPRFASAPFQHSNPAPPSLPALSDPTRRASSRSRPLLSTSPHREATPSQYLSPGSLPAWSAPT